MPQTGIGMEFDLHALERPRQGPSGKWLQVGLLGYLKNSRDLFGSSKRKPSLRDRLSLPELQPSLRGLRICVPGDRLSGLCHRKL